MSRNMTIEVTGEDGTVYHGEIMTIERTMLGFEDHGMLSAYLTCAGQGNGIIVGGFMLDKHVDGVDSREGTAFGMDHLVQIIRTVEVDTWEELKGKTIIVLFPKSGSLSGAVGIAGLTNKRVLNFQQHADAWRERHETVSA